MMPIQMEPPLNVPICDFVLSGPDIEGGIFRIRRDHERYNAFFSIQDLFRLFEAEGINPLKVPEPITGYRFTRVAVTYTGCQCGWLVDGEQRRTIYKFIITSIE